MTQPIPAATLTALVREHFEADTSHIAFEPVRTGHFNTTYFVSGLSRPLVLRIAPPDGTKLLFYERGMMAQEQGIHNLVRERTSAPVPEIIAYDTTCRHIDRHYLLMERLPGGPLSEFGPSPSQFDRALEQTGRYLREIHQITAARFGYLGEHHCMEPRDDWASAFRVMWGKLIDDVVEAGYYDSHEERFARELLDRHSRHFDRPVTSRLLHMDIWSQNVLVDADANVTGIVDFDRAVWGDKEIEFAILDYCGFSEPAFWRGYGQERDVSEPARIRRLFYLAYEVQKYIPIYHYRNRDPQAALRYKRSSLELLRELE